MSDVKFQQSVMISNAMASAACNALYTVQYIIYIMGFDVVTFEVIFFKRPSIR